MSSDMDDTSCVLAGAGAAAPSWDSDDMARERSKKSENKQQKRLRV